MEEEDKEFFILVLGVLAAILLVVSWWFTTGGTSVATTTSTTTESASHSDDDESHDDGADEEEVAAPAEEPEADPVAEEPEAEEPAAEEPDVEEPVVEEAVTLPSTVFDAIAGNPNLSVVTGLLRDSELDGVLASAGPFTVLAPSNDAVTEAASSDTTVAVLAADQESVLTYHVLPDAYTLEELTEIASGDAPAELTTVQGETITLSLDEGNVIVNGSTAVMAGTSEETGNGFVHTLDNVLVPPVGALNAIVGLEPILFASGSAQIQAESFTTLDSFIEILSASNVNVAIEGHTDSSGDPVLNQNLSQDRAQAVLNYLVANGVDEERLGAQGFGADRPVADNDTEDGRALNRRIEFTLG